MEKITCGLEIHQQINCKKLFCECDSIVQEKKPDYTIVRKMRAVVGETGEIDEAAAHEAMRGKTYVYEAYDENCCLVELDEEPPRNLRKEAFEAVMQIAKILNANFVDEVQVMRKTIIDGSNTAAFQRTALIAMDGNISTSYGKVTIPTIIVEEDSARVISDDETRKTYRLDRLGIPLIEISTGPEIHSPEQCQEVAEYIGMLLRSTGKVKRGLGTIRQDVNVSVPGGARVEIKGAQDLKLLPTIVKLEGERQTRLLEIKEELKKREVSEVKAEIKEITVIMKNTASNILKSALTKKGKIFAIKLEKFKGLVGKEIQPNRRLGTEFTDYARIKAGLSIMHSDELPNFGITKDEVEIIRKFMNCTDQDAFILTAGDSFNAERALSAVIGRAKEAIKGVPGEVRKANENGTSTYMRPIPGAARMYPETDVLPIRIKKEVIDSVQLPELIDNKIKRYETLGLGKDLAVLVAKSEQTVLFDEFIGKFKKIKLAFIAETLLTSAKTIRRQFNKDVDPTDDDFRDLFAALNAGAISKESVLDILKEGNPVKDVLNKFRTLSDKELKKVIENLVNENKGQPFNMLMGKAMVQLRGKASGEKVAELLKKLI
ncbi:Glu-tRNA(Gln) amidotransferase GatDE subunit E [Candidatus Woesearchaeota archaeon CG10_big_fil_rev_8_21_14_0_10_37_12]|nr:MAG: Glu-tRNA(Gln) amidotransferase GatDE subunit E [Candidatus Woesearchaeota archaeon CG10_big_fil_rev_8_21_14_0_10_37_12]